MSITNKGQVAREHSDLTIAVARQIKSERQSSDMSQQELASRAGMSISTLRRVESGGRPPTMGQVEDLANALGLTLSALIRRAEDSLEAAAEEPVALRFPLAAEVAAMELRLSLEAEAAGEDNAEVTGASADCKGDTDCP